MSPSDSELEVYRVPHDSQHLYTYFLLAAAGAAIRATELVADYPGHVAAAWLGHSQPIVNKHYWQVTDADLEKATAKKPTQSAHEMGRAGSQDNSDAQKKAPVFPASAISCDAVQTGAWAAQDSKL